jgi:hypothetical protein
MTYLNKLSAYQRATQQAQEILKARGIHYPLPSGDFTPEQNHARIQAYAEQESALVVEILRAGNKPKEPQTQPEPSRKYRDWHD